MAKKQRPEYKILQKRSGRFEVVARNGKNINGDEKAAILVKEGKIQAPKTKKDPAPAEEASAES